MTELEDAVRRALRFDAERIILSVDPERQLARRQRGRAGAVVRVLAVAAVVAAIAGVTFGLSRHHSTSDHGKIATTGLTSAKISGLLFDLPQGARVVRAQFSTGAVAQPLGWIINDGWIINQTPKPECERHGNVGTCHGPFTSLSAGQYAVTFVAAPDEGEFHATTTAAGLPASVATSNIGCIYGFTVDIETSANPSYPKTFPKGDLLGITACFGSKDAKLIPIIRAMIMSARR